ncbi:unnamed protein product [Prunus brigantina]
MSKVQNEDNDDMDLTSGSRTLSVHLVYFLVIRTYPLAEFRCFWLNPKALGMVLEEVLERDRDEALTIKLGEGRVVKGLDHGVVSMKKGEIALFTLPAKLSYGVVSGGGSVVTSNVVARFEVELVSL